MFSNIAKPKATDDYEKYIKISLQENYYFPCIKICINDFASAISGSEKLCLAKCLDRAYDYMRVIEKNNNPMTDQVQKKYFTKIDGLNMLGMKKQKLF